MEGVVYSPGLKQEQQHNTRSFHVLKEGTKNSLDRSAVFDLIRSCANQKDLLKGSGLHTVLVERGLLANDVSLGNALLRMYINCGVLVKAQEFFGQLNARNVVTWNSMIAGYVQHGLDAEALMCFGQMSKDGIHANAVTFIYALKACSNLGAVEKGEEMHIEIGRQGLLEKDIVVGTALVDMYAKCGALVEAQSVFDKLPARNVITWTVLISGYTRHGAADKALTCFEKMQDEGVPPDAGTYVVTLKACASTGALDKGKKMHYELDKHEMLKKNIVLGTALIDMYAKCGDLVSAHKVFDNLHMHDTASWTALMSGYAQHGPFEKALTCYDRMRDEGLSPDAASFVLVLKACGSLRAYDKGEDLHAEISKQGLLEKDIGVGNALVDMYGKCGMLEKARAIFNELPARDVTSWTSLIDGYLRQGLGDEALSCFSCMKDEGLSPNAVTFRSVLKACGNTGSLRKGAELHAEVDRHGLCRQDIALGTALVDMYSKCGALAEAQHVFDKLVVRDEATWTALMAGYSQVGEAGRVFDMLEKMVQEGLCPSSVTFSVLLTACSHTGLVQEGQKLFITMPTMFHILPSIEHQICMVDMFSRAGLSGGAWSIIQASPLQEPLLLSALIAASNEWGNLDFGKRDIAHASLLDENTSASYVIMKIMSAAAGMQGYADEV